MDWTRIRATARTVGRITFIVLMSVLFVAFIALGVVGVMDRDQPRYWGTYTEYRCEPPEFGRGECRSIGIWVSEDGSIVKDPIYLDGAVGPDGTVLASFTPTGLLNDEDNNIVHTARWTGAGVWLSWVATAVTAIATVGYALRWWSRWGQLSTWREMINARRR